MIITKFGGTSLRDAACLRRVAAIVAERRFAQPVVVVSAAAGVTRRLLRLGEIAAAGNVAEVRAEADRLYAAHVRILGGLELEAPVDRAARGRLDRLLAALRATLDELAFDGAYTPRLQDAVLGFGERFSSALMVAAARGVGLPVVPIDAASVMVTDDQFRRARPQRPEIGRRARAVFAPVVAAGRLVVTEGFIGATREGVATTMGFEASDLSASLLGAALDAAEVQIWTDVPGMLTTGHPAVENVRVVPRLTFDEAAELALFGAKVLHPGSVAPARAAGIPVRILPSRDPHGEGTWIGDDSGECLAAAGATPGEAGPVAPRVKAIAVSANPMDDSFAGMRATLRLDAKGGWDGRPIVCPVGQGIGADGTVLETMTRALEADVGLLALARRPHAVPVAVPAEHLDDAVVRLHEALIANATVVAPPTPRL